METTVVGTVVMENTVMTTGTEKETVEMTQNTGIENEIVENGVENKEEEIRIIVASKDMPFVYYNIDVSHEEMSVNQFMERLHVFKFNDPIQRNSVWSIDKKSLLIVSILEEVSIGEIKTQIIRYNKKKYRNVLDGKQRLTTIRDFVRNRYALKNAFVRCFDEEGIEVKLDISGMTFEELPQAFKDRILALVLDIKNYDELDDKLKAELFQRWNNGEALKPSQLRKAKMSYDLLFSIAELKQLEVCQAGFSASAVNNDANSDMLLKALAVLKTDNHTALDSKTIDKYLEDESFNIENINELKEIALFLDEAYKQLDEKVAKKSFGASKTVTLFYVGRKAIEEKITSELFAQWIEQFFVTEYKKTGYAGTSSGTTKIDAVKKRNQIGLDHFISNL